MTERLARWCSSHPWRTLAVWSAAIVVSLGVVATVYGDVLSSDADVTSQTDAKRADALISERFPHQPREFENDITEVVVIRSASGSANDAPFRARVDDFADALRAVGATRVVTPADDPQLISSDGDAAAVLVGLGYDDGKIPALVAEVQQLSADPDLEAGVTGELTSDEDEGQLALDDLRNGELFFGAPAALVILLLVFGAVVAGLVPLILALLSILVALALVALVGQAWGFSEFVQNMVFGMGLALGIDYSLFILSRYREERSKGRDESASIAAAGATASRAVLFSGMAYVLAMLGLLLVPHTIMRSLAGGAILVGLVSILAALTLLPAVLGLLGDRVNALRLPLFGHVAAGQAARESRFWRSIVRVVLRRPVASLAAATVVLLAAASPVLALETGSAGVSTLPDRFPSKQGFVLLNAEFPDQTVDPVVIAVDGDATDPRVQDGIRQLEAGLVRNRSFGAPEVETNPARDLTVITVPVAGDAFSKDAVAAVRDLRSELIPKALAGVAAEAFVTGDTAAEIDYFDVMDAWRLPVFAFVLGLSFILLTIAFRSIVLPAKAIALNLLSVGAAYGLLVLVFQKGYGNEIFGFQQVETIAAWVPLFLFAVLFGLSMDYQVFLLSRIRERFSQTGDNEQAIEFGISSTARLITGAALIIIAVFAGFARGDLVMFQQMGFGVALALLLDATVIRSILVPASMKLLGEWNWYLPSWLEWLPDIHAEGAPERASAHAVASARSSATAF